MANIQFEDILPWGTTGGDTGLSSRLKLKRNFGKIKMWIDSTILPHSGPFTIWGQTYWQHGQPQNVSGSLEDVEDISMSGAISFNDNSGIYEDSSRRLRLVGYNGIQADHNLLIGADLAIKTAAVGENGTDLLAYKSGDWGGVTGAHWFVGVAGVDGFIRSDGELKRWANNENQYTIWDSSNLTPSNYLQLTGGTLKGTLTFALPNGTHYGAIRAEKIGNDEYLYLWGNDGVLIDGLSVRKDNAIVPIEDVFLNLTGGLMEPGATITLQEIVDNIPVQTLVASQRWVNAQGFLTSHQSLANYVTLDGTETITGQKTFGGIVNLQSDVYVTPAGTLYLQTYDSASRPVSSPAASQSWVSSQGFLTSAALSGYATTSQLNTGLAAKQNKIHFLNRNNNDTESGFSYLYLPLMNVNSGYAELDVLPLSGGSMTGNLKMELNKKLLFDEIGEIYANQTTLMIGGNSLHIQSFDGKITIDSSDGTEISKDGTKKLTVGNDVRVRTNLNLDVNKLVFQNGHIENTTQDGGYMRLSSASGQFHFHGESAYGTCVAAAFTQQSDARLKEVTRQLTPGIEDIAAAPIVAFRWKDGDGNENLGTLAQYWQTVLPQAVHEDAEGFLSVEYGTIALASAVTAARKAVALEQRVSELERLLATK